MITKKEYNELCKKYGFVPRKNKETPYYYDVPPGYGFYSGAIVVQYTNKKAQVCKLETFGLNWRCWTCNKNEFESQLNQLMADLKRRKVKVALQTMEEDFKQ